MKKNFKSLVSFMLIFAIVLSTSISVFADTGSNQYYLSDNNSIAWNTSGGSASPITGVYTYKVVYLSKAEAGLVYGAFRDSAFSQEYKTVMDYLWRSGSGVASGVTVSALSKAAQKLGCKKLASYLGSLPAGVVIGIAVDDVLNFVRYFDSRQFQSAIAATQDGKFVQIKMQLAYSMTTAVPTYSYAAWNKNIVEGMPNVNGFWNKNISIEHF